MAASNASRPSTSDQYTAISPPRSLARTSTQGSTQSVKSNLNGLSQGESTISASRMAVPPHPARAQSRSPSEQAAFLAAARVTPTDGAASVPRRAATTRRPAAPPKPRRLSSYGGTTSGNEADTPTDSTSIPPTTSLVDLFERKSSISRPTGRRPEPVVIKPSGDLPLQSPKPLRAASGISSMIQMHVDGEQKDEQNTAENSATAQTTNKQATPPMTLGSTNASVLNKVTAANDLAPLGVQDPNQSKRGYAVTKREHVKAQNTMPSRAGPDTTYLEPMKSNESRYGRPAPSPSPLRDSTVGPIAIHVNKSATAPIEAFSPSSASLKSIPAQYNLLHPRRQTPNMTGEQLANAMVASSLASSRQQSPARQLEAPPLPIRRHKHHTLSLSRTPSPSKTPGLKKTLRQPQSEESDDDDYEGLYPHSKRKVQKRLGKHPNKHHEGDRKRWREIVTERERKRYEGVWAANKGLYSSFTVHEHAIVSRAPKSLEAQELREMVAEQVSNIVVRDIWSRSRLPETVLENVWDLVDNNQVGRLSKEEFVVGLWLIDGHLKGKKLPVKVSDSVWRSVKGLHGISLKVKK